MRLLLSAYHCNPLDGSEPGLGWALTAAAAQNHDVWLIVHGKYREQVRAGIASHPELSIQPTFLGETFPRRFERLGYLRWQRQATGVARELHGRVHFDLVHHVTLTNSWLDAGVAELADVPFVWGPVCGVPAPPLRYWRWFGWRGAAEDAVRAAVSAAGRRRFGRRLAARASVLVAANRQSVEGLPSRWPPVVQPACVVDADELPAPTDGPTSPTEEPTADGPTADASGGGSSGAAGPARRAVFAGRLLPYKGLRLALGALRQPAAAGWRLDVFGQGPQEPAVRRLISRWHLDDRVRLHGAVGRQVLLGQLADADALLFPSLHECSPWVVAEALALGCPVVGVDWGGVPTLLARAGGGGVAVPVRGDLARGVAEALGSVGGRGRRRLEFDKAHLPGLVDAWYRLAGERGP